MLTSKVRRFDNMDAVETTFFLRQLEYVQAQTYDVQRPPNMVRNFLPVKNDIPSHVQTYRYRQWDKAGMAKIVASWAHDFPRVDVSAKEFESHFKNIGDSYGFNIDEIRAARAEGTGLEQRKAQAARDVMEQKQDELFAMGSTIHGLLGLLNQPNATIYTVPNGASASPLWANKTAPEILKDLHGIVTSITSATKNIHPPDTIILPQRRFDVLVTTIMSSTDSRSVLEVFLKMNPYVKNVVPWWKLEGAGSGGTDRMVAYQRNPNVLQALVAQEFEQFPPQEEGLDYVVPCRSKIGGVVVYYPLAIAYGDGI